MTRVIINPGVCGFLTTVEVAKAGKRKASVNITTDCEMVTALGESLTELDHWDAFNQRADSEVHRQASKHALHSVCPVPIGILKAIEVEFELALPRDVSIRFDTSEHN